MIQTRTSETFVARRQPVTTSAAVGGCKRGCRQGSGMYLRTDAHPGEATSDVCFRWTAGPDTRLLLIAVVSLRMLFFDSRALQTWQASGRVRGLCDGLVLRCRSLARSSSINQSIAGERGEKAMGVRRDAGRQMNKYDYGSRAWGVAGTTHDMRFYRQVT
jgi:hypothetical protein